MPAQDQPRVQTLRQAKRAFKLNPTTTKLSEQQQRKIDRECILAERAENAREKQKRRQQALKRKAAKEEAGRRFREQNGIGLATQLVGYSHSQKAMKKGMEMFVRANRVEADCGPITETGRQVSPISVELPDIGDGTQDQVQISSARLPERKFGNRTISLTESFGEGIDDESLFEAAKLLEPQIYDTRTSHEIAACEKKRKAVSERFDSRGRAKAKGHQSVQVYQAKSPHPSQRRRHAASAAETVAASPASDYLADFIASDTQIANEITTSELGYSESSCKPIADARYAQAVKSTKVEKQRPARLRQEQARSAGIRAVKGPMHVAEGLFKRPALPALRSANVVPAMRQRERVPAPTHPLRTFGRQTRSQTRASSHSNPPHVSKKSSFAVYGLSTQAVHCLADDDGLDLSDEEAWTTRDSAAKDAPSLPQQERRGYIDNDRDGDSDSFGSEIDFG